MGRLSKQNLWGQGTKIHRERVPEICTEVQLSTGLNLKLYVGRVRLYRAGKVSSWVKDNYWGAVN